MTAARNATRDLGILIRRAELECASNVVEDVVWELANVCRSAARWSRAAFHPYFANGDTRGTLQAKAMFLACADGSAESRGSRADRPIAGKRQIVGFAAFSAIFTVSAGEATLENMVVAAEWQRRGIGSRLLEAGLLWCRTQTSRTVFLEVRQSNRAAIELYERAGFLVVGNRPGYYRDPAEDGLQMQKALEARGRSR
ncbi:MAG: GNAT family N-acetyltransferase [Acidobacteriota bacterium]